MSDDDFYKTMKAKPLLDRLEWAAFKMCQRGHHEDFASDVMTEAKARIETLEAALSRIYAWYPISVTQPHQTIDDMREFARAALAGEKKDD